MRTAAWVKQKLQDGNIHDFYISTDWRRLRASVLADDHQECQRCKEHGKYTPATTVHHVNYVCRHPELAFSRYYTDGEGKVRRNLVSLCHDCHETVHGYRQKQKKKPLTEERW